MAPGILLEFDANGRAKLTLDGYHSVYQWNRERTQIDIESVPTKVPHTKVEGSMSLRSGELVTSVWVIIEGKVSKTFEQRLCKVSR